MKKMFFVLTLGFVTFLGNAQKNEKKEIAEVNKKYTTAVGKEILWHSRNFLMMTW